MSELILDPGYWKHRLEHAQKGDLHHAVFRCPLDRWQRIEEKHRKILAEVLGPNSSVLDCGCGWGRLLKLMPGFWVGRYLGVDLSPDFIDLARQNRLSRDFLVCDLRNLSELVTDCGFSDFDWAICVSLRPMVKRNLGDDVWQQMEKEIRHVAKKLLFLEYDELDEGSVE